MIESRGTAMYYGAKPMAATSAQDPNTALELLGSLQECDMLRHMWSVRIRDLHTVYKWHV
jgi:hypothetical protein